MGRVENIVGTGENAGYQHFLLFPQCFQKLLPRGRQKLGFCGNELTEYVIIMPLSFSQSALPPTPTPPLSLSLPL